MPQLHVNHEFLLSYAQAAPGNVLDYGCGGGELVEAGLIRGIPIWGFDTYGAGHSSRRNMLEEGLLRDGRVRYARDGKIPFEDHYFSMVVSNQVFEHVHDLDLALAEVSRVLKPRGTVVALFPTREVLREGHIGIPMAHWWPAGSKARALWIKGGRKLGLGHNKDGKSTADWSRDATEYLNNWTAYRSLKQFRAATQEYFTWSSDEQGYIRFRLAKTRAHALERTTKLAGVSHVQRWLLTELFGRVIVLRKI